MSRTKFIPIVWGGRNDNTAFGTYKNDVEGVFTEPGHNYIVEKNNGGLFPYRRRKCVSCGAAKEACVSWFRIYKAPWQHSREVRIHEQCLNCGRTSSFLFYGIKGEVPVDKLKKPRRPRDYYKSRVYKWEEEFITQVGKEKLLLEEADNLLQGMFEPLEIPRAPLKLGRGSSRSVAGSHIELNSKWGLMRWVVIHEGCHWIIQQAIHNGMIDPIQDHGKEWLGLFITHLTRFQVADRDLLQESAQEHKLSFWTSNEVYKFERDLASFMKTKTNQVRRGAIRNIGRA